MIAMCRSVCIGLHVFFLPSLDAQNCACYVAASPVIPYLNNASLGNSGARGE